MFQKLQYISQGITIKEQSDNIQHVLDAGGKWIQLRIKDYLNNEIFDLAEQVKKLCSIYQATFIVNDHVDIAKKVDADGVHLGLEDTSVLKARLILGNNKIIGGSANTLQDVRQRIYENCDYIGLGPFRFTSTKETLSPVLGLEGLAMIMEEVLSNEKIIPIYAIGGITLDDVPAIIETGVYGVAVSVSITTHPDKKELIQKFNLLLNEKIDHSR